MERSLKLKYLGTVVSDEVSKPEILSKTAYTTAAFTRLKPVWNDRSISLSSKTRLMCSLVISIFLYVCESWTLTEELQRIRAMEMRCYRKILGISFSAKILRQAWSSPSLRGRWRTEKKWRKLVVKSSVVLQRPLRLREKWGEVKFFVTRVMATRVILSMEAQVTQG